MSEKTVLFIENKGLKIKVNLYVPTEVKIESSIIIAFPDVFGVDFEKTNVFLQKLSVSLGVPVALMDTFRSDPWNNGTPVNMDFSKFPAWLQKHPFETEAYVDIVSVCNHFKQKYKQMATIGFCMGGNYSYLCLCDSSTPINFGVACYPSRFDPEISKKLSFPMFALFGETDNMIPLENVKKLQDNLKESKIETKIEIYSKCGHAFIHNSHDQNATKEQIETVKKGFQDIIEWFETHFN
eukprot:gene6597-10760_t